MLPGGTPVADQVCALTDLGVPLYRNILLKMKPVPHLEILQAVLFNAMIVLCHEDIDLPYYWVHVRAMAAGGMFYVTRMSLMSRLLFIRAAYSTFLLAPLCVLSYESE